MARYLMRIWGRHVATHPGGRRLPPIIPIVVYQGRQPWTPPLSLIDLIDVDRDTATFAPNFFYLLEDLHRLDPAELRARPLSHTVRLTFLLMREAPGNRHLARQLAAWQTELQGLLDDGRLADLSALWTYALRVSNTPEPELTDYLARLGPEAKEVAMTTADLLRAEGEVKGRAEALLDLLSIKFTHVPADIDVKVRSASSTQLETWTRRVLTATTLDEIFS